MISWEPGCGASSTGRQSTVISTSRRSCAISRAPSQASRSPPRRQRRRARRSLRRDMCANAARSGVARARLPDRPAPAFSRSRWLRGWSSVSALTSCGEPMLRLNNMTPHGCVSRRNARSCGSSAVPITPQIKARVIKSSPRIWRGRLSAPKRLEEKRPRLSYISTSMRRGQLPATKQLPPEALTLPQTAFAASLLMPPTRTR